MDSFEVLNYSPNNLAYSLKNDFITAEAIISGKFHYRSLLDYLGEDDPDALGAHTIVIEHNYVSRSFLNDYSAYYSLCFNDDYRRKCNRIHFFKSTFTQDDFKHEITSGSCEKVNDDTYLGYIVVKNLPTVILGATLLKTYNNNPLRVYITRDCEANLFGKKLRFKSLIFQEQDKVVSACATCALWIAFYKTSSYFQTPLPSPSDITASAKNSFNASGRIFPNKEGLDHFQIGNAIENVGLVFELRNKANLKDPFFVKSFIYAYCKLGIPVLLGLDIPQKGRHLITISGYKNEDLKPRKTDLSNISLTSYNLKSFYAHDDRIGPFSRLQIADKVQKDKIIETSWWIDNKSKEKYKADVVSIIVPLSKEIRITFEDILNDVRKIDYQLKKKLSNNYNLIWDIYLNTSNDYKIDVISNSDLSPNFKEKVVFVRLPKYVWIARLIVDDLTIFELVFDTTDVSQGHICLMINCFDEGLLSIIKTELKVDGFRQYISKELNVSYLQILDSMTDDFPSSGHK